MTTVISVEHLSKAYRLGQIGTGTFSYDLALWWAKLRGKPSPLLKIGETDHGNRDGETLWALKDVSFTVEQGEVLGIIGRNGAGKSTLLKILSRVTAPTSGRIRVKGRVASLLEVGTGFHPELSGRENIYLNGAILGMSRREIDRKFDEIVDFAEVEKFIETPVKRYSSGMYVRLAFAVAAHLEPEILIVDEVLSVGDIEFQKKCLGKMHSVATRGKTVLFVSHSIGTIQSLCERLVWLDKGIIIDSGSTNLVLSKYTSTAHRPLDMKTGVFGNSKADVFFRSAGIQSKNGSDAYHIPVGDPVEFVLRFECNKSITTPFFVIMIKDESGLPVSRINSFESAERIPPANKGGMVKVDVSSLNLTPGKYSCDISVHRYGEQIEELVNSVSFEIIPSSYYPTGKYPGRNFGSICLPCEWTFDYE